MYIPKKLYLKNFGSFENVEYEFEEGRATLIQGINLSDVGSKSNGSGKSHFGASIYYALVGTSIDKGKRDKQLIRRGTNQAFISLELINTFLKETLRIDRTINEKGSSTLDIYINNESLRDKYATVKDGNALILEMLDITVNELQSYYLINADRFISFFNIPDSSKKDFIGAFSNANVVKEVDSYLDNVLLKCDENLESIRLKEESVRSVIEALKDSIERLKSKDYASIEAELNEEKRKELDAKKAQLEKSIVERKRCELSIESYKKECERLSKWINVLEKFSYVEMIVSIEAKVNEQAPQKSELNEVYESLRVELNDWKRKLTRIENSLESKIKCPKCNHIFNLQDEHFDYQKYLRFQKGVVNEINNVQDLINLSKEELKSISDNIKKDKSLKDHYSQQDYRRVKLIRDLSNQLNKIVKKKTSAEETLSSLNLKSIVDEKIDSSKEIKLLMKEDKKTIKESETLIKNREVELLELKESRDKFIFDKDSNVNWKSEFKQFYTYLINKSLLYLESNVNSTLQKMNTNLSINIEGYKVLANGKDIRENINVLVKRDGFLEDEISTYSAGERGRLTCAMILANQDIINARSKSGGLNLLVIDEVLDSIDSLGMQSLVNSMSNLKKCIFVITHIYLEQTEDEMDIDVLTVTKEGGVSYLSNS